MTDDFSTEYYALLDLVKGFEQRLLTIKGWGVTLSLAALAWGFQNQHYGLFLVATLSGLAFWATEGVLKRHQQRFYVRMREIEVLVYEQKVSQNAQPDAPWPASTPQIDWGWEIAADVYNGKLSGAPPAPERYGEKPSYRYTWILPHVAFPHIISVVAGALLYLMGVLGLLGMPL